MCRLYFEYLYVVKLTNIFFIYFLADDTILLLAKKGLKLDIDINEDILKIV